MAHNPITASRRGVLGALAVAPVVAALPASSAVARFSPDRRVWDAAVKHLEQVQAEFDRINPIHSAAFDAAEAACPRREEFFTRYRLGCGVPRERNVRAARTSIVLERFYGYHNLTDEQVSEATAAAERVVDDFDSWRKKHQEAYREADALEERYIVLFDQRDHAREAVLAAPAPDQAALLFKIELLATIMRDAEVEDADRIAAVSADAVRLLSNGRA